MRRFVSDTQCVLWYLARDRRLPKPARAAFDAAEDEEGRGQVVVPSIAVVEAVFLVQRNRLPSHVLNQLLALPDTPDASIYVVPLDMKVHVLNQLLALPDTPDASIYVVPLDMKVARAVSDFGPAAVPELADRIVAATARALNLPLLTTDPTIEASGLVKVAK
jgi:PIN domain nuclease of toxin-antitoxin system